MDNKKKTNLINRVLHQFGALGPLNEDNWDGYGADPINDDSYEDSLEFMIRFPDNIPIPEISVDPDGMVSFEWWESKRSVYSISFEKTREIAYAGLFGDEKIHGKDNFRTGIPESVLNNILRVFS